MFAEGEAKLLCDKVSFQFLKGSTVEFAESLMKSAFQVISIVLWLDKYDAMHCRLQTIRTLRHRAVVGPRSRPRCREHVLKIITCSLPVKTPTTSIATNTTGDSIGDVCATFVFRW